MKFICITLLIIFGATLKADIKADFRASKKNAFIEEDIYFENLSKGDSLQFKWNFGDFSSNTEKSPIHNYNVAGTFDVQLIAYNSFESDTAIKEDYITIHKKLIADFDYDLKSATGGYSVNCINLSQGDINSYEWNFYNGTISTDQNPTAIYDKPGQYNISLKVSDSHFTDSIFISDIVEIHHPQLNIENVNNEHIYYDIGSNSSLGSKHITNGYLTATEGNRFFQIIKFNHNRDLSWKKKYRNSYFNSVKFDVDAFDKTWIALNSDLHHTNIEVIGYDGEQNFIISDPFDVSENGDYNIEQVANISSGMAVIANIGKEAMLLIYNYDGDIIYDNSIADDDCLIDEYNIDFIKIAESYNDDIYIFMRKSNESENEHKYYYTHLKKTGDTYECMNISNGLCSCSEIPDITFEKNSEFIIYDEDKMLYIQGRKVFNVDGFTSDNPEFFNYSNLVHTEIYDIELLKNDKFAVAGKFNGHMNLSVVDLKYDVVTDYLLNRQGFLKSVLDDGNGNLVVTGTIKKNYEEDALYYFNVPYDQFLSIRNSNENDAVTLYPNPADDVLTINSFEIISEVKIFDVSGKLIKKINTYSGNIDISDLKKGSYLIEFNNKTYKFIKK